MDTREKSQYQCMNCGTIHWIEDPLDIDEDELYTKMRCKHCKQIVNHLWVGTEQGDEYLYYDCTLDERFFNYKAK